MKYLFSFFTLVFSLHVAGQTDTTTKAISDTADFDKEFKTVQIQAKFPGGPQAWGHYLEKNLNFGNLDKKTPKGSYPVTVNFLVDKQGKVSEVTTENNPGYGTAEEAIRVIKKGPKWSPAIQNGKNVIYRQKQSITFVIDSKL